MDRHSMKSVSLLVLFMALACGSVWAQNKALSLDGDGDYVEVQPNASLSILDYVTVSAWINISASPGDSNWRNIIGQPDPHRNYNFYIKGNGKGKWALHLAN